MKAIWDKWAAFGDMISQVEMLEYSREADVEGIKLKVCLKDGSSLRLLETIVDGALRCYSYYWLDEENRLIIGWDNAPHHREVATHPHHKHIGDQHNVKASAERCFEEVMSFIRDVLGEARESVKRKT